MSKKNQRLKSTRVSVQQANAVKSGAIVRHEFRPPLKETKVFSGLTRQDLMAREFHASLPPDPHQLLQNEPYSYLPLEVKTVVDESGAGSIGKYHFCCIRGELAWAVGYCSQIEVCPDCGGKSVLNYQERIKTEALILPAALYHCNRCDNRGYVAKDDACPGHDTPEAARDHYFEYVVDSADYAAKISIPVPCAICGGPTTSGAHGVCNIRAPLCREHLSPDGFRCALLYSLNNGQINLDMVVPTRNPDGSVIRQA